MLRFLLPVCVIFCGCRTDLIVDPLEGGAGGSRTGGSGAGGSGAGGSGAGGSGAGGSGGAVGVGGRDAHGGEGGHGGREEPTQRTIVVDVELGTPLNADEVVVLVSAPDGGVRDSWTGDQLPVDAGVNDGDLVSYLYRWADWSVAHSYRVTSEVTAVRARTWSQHVKQPCEHQEPMTVRLMIPAVEGANHYSLALDGPSFIPSSQLGPGTHEVEVQACEGVASFDLLLLSAQYSNSDPLAFARVDDIAYAPGSTVDLPIAFSTERTNVDIVVEGAPGTEFRVRGSWLSELGLLKNVSTSLSSVLGDAGTTALSYGPFALGEGTSSVQVSIPDAPYFWCELDLARRLAPFGATPFHVELGALARFAPTVDGNVAIGDEGDVGDVLIRSVDEYASSTPAYWAVHEDPLTPYPLPAPPEVPAGLLPDFEWPVSVAAEVRHIHTDHSGVDGYAPFARGDALGAEMRTLQRLPDDCY